MEERGERKKALARNQEAVKESGLHLILQRKPK